MLLSVKPHVLTWLLCVAVTVAGALAWTAPAYACRCAQASFDAHRAEADAIFEGRVLSVSPDPVDGQRVEVRIHVTQTWRGAASEELTLVTASESAACGVQFEVGASYLVLARVLEDGLLSTHACSGTVGMDTPEAGEARAALGSGTVPVDVENGEIHPLPGREHASAAGCASCSLHAVPSPAAMWPSFASIFCGLVWRTRRLQRRR